jgi:Na+/H+ antiporter NhaC
MAYLLAQMLAVVPVDSAWSRLKETVFSIRNPMTPDYHPYGAWSLLPTAVAILAAVISRRLLASLLLGIYSGALLTSHFNPLKALGETWETHLWSTLIDPERLRVFSFTLLMGALIGVITRSGGMQGLISKVAPWARTRRRGQLTAWLMGLIIFFDDYANSLLLGTTFRPIADRLRISREKLAYIVDSTAAPIAGLALISTWVAVEIAYVRSGLVNVDASLEKEAFGIFVSSIPYRFYILMALIFVPLTAILGRDFGGMLVAERNRLAGDHIDPRHPTVAHLDQHNPASSWTNAIAPIVLTVVLVITFILKTGIENSEPGASLNEIMGGADPALALQYGAFGGLALAVVLANTRKLLTGSEILEACLSGAKVVSPAILILWFASTISAMTSNKSVEGETSVGFEFQDHRLYTGDYLKSILVTPPTSNLSAQAPETTVTSMEQSSVGTPRFPLFLLPTVVFVLAGIVAFCTGTSWGTMGILMPIAIPMAYTLISTESAEQILQHPLMLGSVAGVLSGAIFGDHCSPISDTTVLSSQACSCDLIAHVVTQMPYALSVAAINILLGTIPLGLGWSVWILLPLQLVAVFALLIVVGGKVEVE